MTVNYKLEVITKKGMVFLKVETSSKSLLEGILNILKDEDEASGT